MIPDAFAETFPFLGYAHNALDRCANQREAAGFAEGEQAKREARTALIGGEVILLRSEGGRLAPWFTFDEALALGELGDTVFLGREGAAPRFAAVLPAVTAEEIAARTAFQARDLRSLAVDGSLGGPDLGALAQGKAMLNWHLAHGFCSKCGHRSHPAGAGWRRECPHCGTHHFPRTDPVAIMLAVDGDRCLLGRQPRFPAGMYSCLAGFVEPGETIEAAVAREIAEESGVRVGRVTYLGTQPWPFPSSLMIGCLAEALSTTVVPDELELEDVRWFGREDVASMLDGTHPQGLVAPTRMAIAHHIVRAWLDGAAQV